MSTKKNFEKWWFISQNSLILARYNNSITSVASTSLTCTKNMFSGDPKLVPDKGEVVRLCVVMINVFSSSNWAVFFVIRSSLSASLSHLVNPKTNGDHHNSVRWYSVRLLRSRFDRWKPLFPLLLDLWWPTGASMSRSDRKTYSNRALIAPNSAVKRSQGGRVSQRDIHRADNFLMPNISYGLASLSNFWWFDSIQVYFLISLCNFPFIDKNRISDL